MPFQALPANPRRTEAAGDTVLHYFASSPSFPTFLRLPHTPDSAPVDPPTDSSEILDPAHPLLIFLPGEGISVLNVFLEQLRHPDLARTFNLVALSPREGLSTCKVAPSEDHVYDLDAMAEDVVAFVNAISLKVCGGPWPRGVHLVGCSLTGLSALRVAGSIPELVRSVTIASPLPEVEDEEVKKTWNEIQSVGRASTKLPENVRSGLHHRWGADEGIPRNIDDEVKTVWPLLHQVQLSGKFSYLTQFMSQHTDRQPMSDDVVARVRCPVLIVEGPEAAPYDNPSGEALRLRLVNASVRCVTIPGAPFLLSVLRPLEFGRLLLSHVTDGGGETAPLSPDEGERRAAASEAPTDAPLAPAFPPGLSRAEAVYLLRTMTSTSRRPSARRSLGAAAAADSGDDGDSDWTDGSGSGIDRDVSLSLSRATDTDTGAHGRTSLIWHHSTLCETSDESDAEEVLADDHPYSVAPLPLGAGQDGAKGPWGT